MENERILIATDNTDEIPVDMEGIYYEMIICNGTSSPIYLISSNNSKTIVQPDKKYKSGKVVIIKKYSINGSPKRFDSTQMGPVKIPTEGLRIEISDIEISRNPIYVKEVNMMLASIEFGDTIDHPNYIKSYKETLQEVRQSIHSEDATLISFAINDPVCRYRKLYAILGGNSFIIPCTNLPVKDKLLSLSISFISNSKVTEVESCNIEDLDSKGFYICETFGETLIIGTTAQIALDESKMLKVKKDNAINKIVKDRIEECNKSLISDFDSDKTRLKQQIEELKNDVKSKQNDNLSIQNEIARIKLSLEEKDRIISHWETKAKVEDEDHKRTTTSKIFDDRLEEQNFKTKRAKDSYYHDLLKAVAGAAALVLSAVVGASIKSYYQNKN